MNTLFESRATIYWSVMDEYNRHFFLKSPACIVRYIIGFLAICLAVFDFILMKNRPDADMNIVFVVCFAVIAVLFSVMGIIRYFSLKKTGARRDAEISHREVIARVTENGVVTTSEAGDESSVSFSEIKLLYRRNNAVRSDKVISRAYIPEGQLYCRGCRRNDRVFQEKKNKNKIKQKTSYEVFLFSLPPFFLRFNLKFYSV